MRALREAIRERKFAAAYYFFGEDEFLKEEGLRRMIDAAVDPATRDFNLDQRKGADLDAATLSSLLGLPPMMAERRVVVIRNVDELKKEARSTLDAYLTSPSAEMLLVLTASADAKEDRSLPQKTVPVEFDPLTGAQVPKWLVARAAELGTTIAPGAAELLQDAVGPDLSQLSTELAKLAAYCAGREIDEAAVSAIVGVRREETPGRLLDAVAERDARTALALVTPVLMQPKTTAVSVVMALTTQTLALAVIHARAVPPARRSGEFFALLKSGGSNVTGRAWGEAVNAWTRAAGRWTLADLDHALHALLLADLTLKGSRVSSEEQVLATAILAVCGGAAGAAGAAARSDAA